jgi:hypothetical protein
MCFVFTFAPRRTYAFTSAIYTTKALKRDNIDLEGEEINEVMEQR